MKKKTVYHVTTPKKILRYFKEGRIKAPVRAWETIEDAERFCKQTSRPIIIRLKFPLNPKRLDGHRNKAFVVNEDYNFREFTGVYNARKYC